jgi:hypothetical protein
LIVAAVVVFTVIWLMQDRVSEFLDSINYRFGTSFKLPFGVKDRYNIRGTQMTEMQPLYFSADPPPSEPKSAKSAGNKVSNDFLNSFQIKKLAESGTKKLSEKVVKLA